MHRQFVAQRRYNYIGIEEYEDGKCMRTVITGIKPQKTGKLIAFLLNEAYEKGRLDEAQARA